MTVRELKNLLKDAPDDMQVLIPLYETFTGHFYSPCTCDSGVSKMGGEVEGDLDRDEFILVRHAFFDDNGETDQLTPELN